MFVPQCVKLPLIAAITALAALAGPTDVAEAAVCGTRDSVTKLLSNRYKEVPVALGMVSDRGVMEIYVADDKATWSIVVTTPQGRTCIIAAGQNYEGVDLVAIGPEA